ncbi:MAG: hypothetical protein R3B82_20585 [Sandaracinaceae bacterium]
MSYIHFQVRVGDAEYVTSQLFFHDELNAEICGTHPDYADHGLPDTTNDTDTVIAADSADDYILETAKQADGALLAWKTLIIRSSLSDALCDAPGGGGMMGPPRG